MEGITQCGGGESDDVVGVAVTLRRVVDVNGVAPGDWMLVCGFAVFAYRLL